MEYITKGWMRMFNRKPKTPSFYEEHLAKLQKALADATPGTDAYEKIMAEMLKLQEFAGKQKEMKQMFTKEGRGNIAGKIVGFLGLGGLAFGLARFEKNGGLFSGTSNNVVSGIVKIGSRFFG